MRRGAFEKFAWFLLIYLVGVILFGAWVRITHSGAGCGSHWPTCNGAVLPSEASTETLIEFTHRLTSGLCGIFGLALVGWAWRLFGSATPTRYALLTLLFIVFEAAIGAGLVLGELVADDDSAARAAVISLHLANTLVLLAFAALTAWTASGRPGPVPKRNPRLAGLFAGALGVLILTSMSGAVTALGDTLFPIEPTLGPGLLEKVRADVSAANHFLVRLRAVHPLIAAAASFYLLTLLAPRAFAVENDRTRIWARAALAALGAELLIGLLNVALAAPGWLQLVHLLTADVLWVATLLTGAAAVAESPLNAPERLPKSAAEPASAG